MTKKLLSLLVLTALSAAVHAATPPSTLVVAQGLDDIVSLDPAEANELLGEPYLELVQIELAMEKDLGMRLEPDTQVSLVAQPAPEMQLADAEDLFTHTWSLCVEIKWYFLVPFLFMAQRRLPISAMRFFIGNHFWY